MDPFSGIVGSLIWWIFLFYLLMGPQIHYRQLQVARTKLLEKLARKRNSTVITMIHRQESIGFFGIPVYKFISIEDSEEILRAIRMAPKDKPIDLIIHTPGGLVLAATQIAKALKDHPAKTRVIIPFWLAVTFVKFVNVVTANLPASHLHWLAFGGNGNSPHLQGF